ncbi:uncharacterized protein [Apostichopus japonicus]|uniref:uncharacterized protein isoform X1 n=1 Tax=Stichopus japonicus TaxID=307972 RepID=UPI003AB1663A
MNQAGSTTTRQCRMSGRVQGQLVVHVPGHAPLTAQMLAQAQPHEQKHMLGERLFSIIQQSHGDVAGKITGMLLEMDNAELLHMLETDESLKAKISEALSVLAVHQHKEQKKISGVQGLPNAQAMRRGGAIPTQRPTYKFPQSARRNKASGAKDTHEIPQQAVHVPGQAPLTAQMLAQAQPHEQKQMLGERLFSIISQSHGDVAGKITGMLLEMDNAELLHLLQSDESLKAKISEALSVVAVHQQKEQKKISGVQGLPNAPGMRRGGAIPTQRPTYKFPQSARRNQASGAKCEDDMNGKEHNGRQLYAGAA